MITVAEWLDLLRSMHDWIRRELVDACQRQTTDVLAGVAYSGVGDVTYVIDRVSETAIVDWLTQHVAGREPIVLIGEGLPGGSVTLPTGAEADRARWRVIVDPIDGTRGLMYQKRPGWILTGVAPNRGPATTLDDVELAVQTEIPLMKQHLCDQVWAERGVGVKALRYNRLSGESAPLALRPSTARDLRHGYATVCRFFPGGRDVLAAIDDALCHRLLARQPGEAAVFEDQYACTGGQIYGLVSGQDRFVADLRPLVQQLVSRRGGVTGHCCHPYDLCTKLIAEESGVVVTAADGTTLSAPLDTESDVAWVGYANRHLYAQIESVLQELLCEYRLIGAD